MLVKLAFRSLSRQRRRTALTMGAIAIGTAVVVFAWGFGEGIVGWMTHTATNARLGSLQIHAPGYFDVVEADPLRSTFDSDAALVAKVKAVPGIKGVSERLHFSGLVSTGKRSSMVQVDAIDAIAERSVCPDRLSASAAKGLLAPRSIIVGRELAKSLGVERGSSVTLQASTITGAQNALDFVVADVSAGAGFLESKRLVTISIADGRELTSADGKAVELAISVDDAHSADDATDGVARAIAAAINTGGGASLDVHSWRDLSPFMRDMVARIRIILRGVSFVLFIVVVFGVANTMLMSIYERVREIGTMLALGMTRRRILQLFLLEASILAGIGAVVGVSVGSAVVLALARRGIDFTPPGAGASAIITPVWSVAVVVVVVAAAIVGAVVATLAPARRVSFMPPTEALRAP